MNTRRLLLPFLLLMLVFASFAYPRTQAEPPAYTFVGLDDKPVLRKQLRAMSLTSWNQLVERAGRGWSGTAFVVWMPEQQFLQATGFRPEHVAAAASPSKRTIWINSAVWTRTSFAERQQTLTHEFGHLLLADLPGARNLPLWANEGIVMHLAGQEDWEGRLTLLHANLFGTVPELAHLETDFPRNGVSQNLAYRTSYAAVGEVARRAGDRDGSVYRLVNALGNPKSGASAGEEFWSALRREEWQASLQSSLGTKLSSGVILLGGGGFFMLAAAVLVIVAYVKVRNKRIAQDRVETDEERWAESLSDEDVQDIYGDREKRWKD